MKEVSYIEGFMLLLLLTRCAIFCRTSTAVSARAHRLFCCQLCGRIHCMGVVWPLWQEEVQIIITTLSNANLQSVQVESVVQGNFIILCNINLAWPAHLHPWVLAGT